MSARESREYADTVLKILCAHAKSIMAEPGYIEKEKPSNEIAAILDVLFPVISDDANQNVNILFKRVDISYWHLHGADFNCRDMRNIVGGKGNFVESEFVGCELVSSILVKSELVRGKFVGSRLVGGKIVRGELA